VCNFAVFPGIPVFPGIGIVDTVDFVLSHQQYICVNLDGPERRRSIINNIDKAILKSELGLNPINDGTIIRITLPPLTEERRKDLVKIVHKRLEESRISIRNIRREVVDELKAAEKSKEISQDQHIRASEQLQKLTDSHIDSVNKVGKDKEAEIMEA